jgi:hypothetical protein
MLYREIIGVCSQIHTKHINTLCGRNVEILDAFAKLRKATVIFVMSVCLSVCLSARNSAPTGRMFMKFDIAVFLENLSEKFKLHFDRTRMAVLQLTTHVRLGWRHTEFLKCEIFQTKVVDKLQTHVLFSMTYLYENRAVYEIRWKNGRAGQATKASIIWRRILFTCRISKATKTHSEHVTLTALRREPRLGERDLI